MAEHTQTQQGRRRSRNGGHPWAPFWEWVTAGVGFALLAATVGYLVYQGLQPRVPPQIALQVEYVAAQPRGYMVRFRARNGGTEAVADLQVHGVLSDDTGGELEAADATLSYLPGASTREGVLLFALDPRQHRLAIRPVGFHDP